MTTEWNHDLARDYMASLVMGVGTLASLADDSPMIDATVEALAGVLQRMTALLNLDPAEVARRAVEMRHCAVPTATQLSSGLRQAVALKRSQERSVAGVVQHGH